MERSSHCAFSAIQMQWCDAKTLINHHYLKVKVSHGWLAIFNSCVNLEPTISTTNTSSPDLLYGMHKDLYLFSFLTAQKLEGKTKKSSVQKSNWNPCDWLSAKNEWFVQENIGKMWNYNDKVWGNFYRKQSNLSQYVSSLNGHKYQLHCRI